MSIIIKKFEKIYVKEAMYIWNEVIEEGVAFPQLDYLNKESALKFFKEQTYTGLAIEEETNQVKGL